MELMDGWYFFILLCFCIAGRICFTAAAPAAAAAVVAMQKIIYYVSSPCVVWVCVCVRVCGYWFGAKRTRGL